MYVKPGSDTYLTLCFHVGFRYELVWNISFNHEIDLGKIMLGRDCILNFSVDRNEVSWLMAEWFFIDYND
jgi:hypothetical protein